MYWMMNAHKNTAFSLQTYRHVAIRFSAQRLACFPLMVNKSFLTSFLNNKIAGQRWSHSLGWRSNEMFLSEFPSELMHLNDGNGRFLWSSRPAFSEKMHAKKFCQCLVGRATSGKGVLSGARHSATGCGCPGFLWFPLLILYLGKCSLNDSIETANCWPCIYYYSLQSICLDNGLLDLTIKEHKVVTLGLKRRNTWIVCNYCTLIINSQLSHLEVCQRREGESEKREWKWQFNSHVYL